MVRIHPPVLIGLGVFVLLGPIHLALKHGMASRRSIDPGPFSAQTTPAAPRLHGSEKPTNPSDQDAASLPEMVGARAYSVRELGTTDGHGSNAYAINEGGQVVGQALPQGRPMHAFRWSGGAMHDLNRLIPSGAGWVLRTARGINALGQIAGDGTFQGRSRAFLLTPILAE